MILAFYFGGKTIFDLVTRWRTNGKHTHVELVFSNGDSFSSSQWDGGTRFKRIEYDATKWDFVSVRMRAGVREGDIRAWCKERTGVKYDWRGILRFFRGGRGKQDEKRWFCSEICCAALQQFDLMPAEFVASDMSPEDLYIAAKARATRRAA